MKDEIKEILDKAKEISNYGADGKQHTRMFNQFEAKALLDYITNLQEEKRKLKAELELYKDNHNYLNDKIDKAIEYIEEKSEEVELNFYGFPDKITSFKGSVSTLLKILK